MSGCTSPRRFRGLSPRVRGNPIRPTAAAWSGWSIPARAGEPGNMSSNECSYTVYPRACGGTALQPAKGRCPVGLSPRVRGNLFQNRVEVISVRSIPARAGEPAIMRRQILNNLVYPRACGGTQALELARQEQQRSIPARAGEPRRHDPRKLAGRVYPRACGGTNWLGHRTSPCSGLSPRVRGNPVGGDRIGGACGSIPARAGEPRRRRNAPDRWRVYPRACGGTTSSRTKRSPS